MLKVFAVILLLGPPSFAPVGNNIKICNLRPWKPWVHEFKPIIDQYAFKYTVPHERIIATIAVESSGAPMAVSSQKCMGLMQIMPETAYYIKCVSSTDANLFDPNINIECGTKYLKYLWDKYKDWDMVHFAYNWGTGNVQRMLKRGVHPRRIRYVRRINAVLHSYRNYN